MPKICAVKKNVCNAIFHKMCQNNYISINILVMHDMHSIIKWSKILCIDVEISDKTLNTLSIALNTQTIAVKHLT